MRKHRFLLPIALLGSVGLVLAGCGGGGGGGRVPDDPRGPEIPIVPADDHGDTRADATTLALGSSVAGRIETGDDQDFFEIEITEPGTLTVYTTGSLDTVGELQRSDGNRLADDDDGGAQTNFRIERSVGAGTYYVKTGSVGTATGSYAVLARFTPTPPTDDHGNSRSNATALAIGGSVAGEIEEGSDEDFFRVVVTEPGALTVYTTGGLDTFGELLAADGTSLDADDDRGAQRNFRIEQDVAPGTYYVKVSSFRTATGSYVVLAQLAPADTGDDHGDTRSGATALPLGGSVSGEIEEGGDEDFFRVDVAESGTLTLYTTGSLDTLGELLAGDGSSLGSDDDSGTQRNFRIEHHVVPGTYFVRVGSYSQEVGAYTAHAGLEVDHADTPANATPIGLGQSFSGRIDSATDVDYFRLPINTPGRLTIRTSGHANPDIAVFDADGIEIPGIPGSWTGDITQATLDKGEEVRVRFSGGNPGQEYSGSTVFSASQQPVNQPPVIENPFETIRLELTVGAEEPTIPGLPAGETLQCTGSAGDCRVVTEPSLEKAVVFQGGLAFFFRDPEGEGLRFRVRCALGDATCSVAEDDGELQILPNEAKTRGVLVPQIKIRPEIGTVTLDFDITAIDPHGLQAQQTLTIEIVVIDDSWTFSTLPSLVVEQGASITEQVDNAINLLEYVVPTNPDITYDVSLSGGGTVAGLAWEFSSISADGALTYLSFGATDQAPPGIHEFLITATHPEGTTRQETLSVEVVAGDGGGNGDPPEEPEVPEPPQPPGNGNNLCQLIHNAFNIPEYADIPLDQKTQVCRTAYCTPGNPGCGCCDTLTGGPPQNMTVSIDTFQFMEPAGCEVTGFGISLSPAMNKVIEVADFEIPEAAATCRLAVQSARITCERAIFHPVGASINEACPATAAVQQERQRCWDHFTTELQKCGSPPN